MEQDKPICEICEKPILIKPCQMCLRRPHKLETPMSEPRIVHMSCCTKEAQAKYGKKK